MSEASDRYSSFAELRRSEVEGLDYAISCIRRASGITVMAPHGGNIEPGTTEIADALAGEEHTFYSFEGKRSSDNSKLHITSTRFDEPIGVGIASEARGIVVIHGCKGREPMVCLGGLDKRFKSICRDALEKAGFSVGQRSALGGINELNLCNRGLRGCGIQLELTSGLRRTMFKDLTGDGRKQTTEVFDLFVRTLRKAFADFRGSEGSGLHT